MSSIFGKGSRTAHLLTGVYLAGLVLATTAIVLTDTSFYFQPDSVISLGILGLIPGIILAVRARLERLRVMIAIVPLGILATLASTFYRVAENTGQLGECFFVRVNMGFPLPWSFTYNEFGLRCPAMLPPLFNPFPGMTSFSLDVIFYLAVGLAIIQAYQGITGKTIPAQSLHVNKII